MPFFAKDINQLTADSLDQLSRNTNITKLTAGGKARALLDAVNARLVEAYNVFDLNLTRAFVSAASGQYLDLIGELVGLTRSSPVAPWVSADMQMVKFYVATGTFGDINNSQNIVVPQGTLLSTLPSTAGILYRVSTDIVLPAGDSQAFISIEAMNPGASANVGANALTYSNFIGYADNLNQTLLVTNTDPIATGSNLETDANFRYRISNRVLQAEAANETAIRLAALSVPGVANVVTIPRYRGIGTFGLIVEPVAPRVTEDLLTNVTEVVSLIQGLGTIADIRGPFETGMAMTVTVQYFQQLDENTLAGIENSLDLNIRNYIAQLGIGDFFSINGLVSQMFSVSSQIKNFGVAGTPIDAVYIYKNSAIGDNRVRQQLLGDYQPDFDERVIVEPSLATPFTFNRSFARR